ncbi:hypothetical protein GJA_2745 [Janthinobacterium agaricidamnosum NBRC 102515 = DSM 9628]|uniref:Uncharacterized protein n=1 Tax=Janthinobacterium agaricidamnosum NBRC 102515 = DSM 9628 TaxID=1349767 RepID=W0V673_9BURK|nr:hypothetical protein GJA_2745 [Janthinobacterium agaricidamnosum NBRC 102515 = DSM 9628]
MIHGPDLFIALPGPLIWMGASGSCVRITNTWMVDATAAQTLAPPGMKLW